MSHGRDCLAGERGIGIRVRHEQGHAGRAAAEPGFDDEVVGEDVERVCLERVDDDHGLRIGLPLLDGGVEVVQEVARAGGALQPGIGVGRAHDEAAEPIGHPVDLDAGIQPCAPADALLKLGYRARRRRRGQEQVGERAEAIHVQRDAVGVVHPRLRREVDPRVLVGQGDEVACALQHGRLACRGRVLDVGALPAGLPVANGHEQRPARLVDDIDLTRGQCAVGDPAVVGVLHDLAEPADHLEPALGHQGVVVGRQPLVEPLGLRVEVEHEGRPALLVLADVRRPDDSRMRQSGGQPQLALGRPPDLRPPLSGSVARHVEEPYPLAQAGQVRILGDDVDPGRALRDRGELVDRVLRHHAHPGRRLEAGTVDEVDDRTGTRPVDHVTKCAGRLREQLAEERDADDPVAVQSVGVGLRRVVERDCAVRPMQAGDGLDPGKGRPAIARSEALEQRLQPLSLGVVEDPRVLDFAACKQPPPLAAGDAPRPPLQLDQEHAPLGQEEQVGLPQAAVEIAEADVRPRPADRAVRKHGLDRAQGLGLCRGRGLPDIAPLRRVIAHETPIAAIPTELVAIVAEASHACGLCGHRRAVAR
jgi:hypothetical protein